MNPIPSTNLYLLGGIATIQPIQVRLVGSGPKTQVAHQSLILSCCALAMQGEIDSNHWLTWPLPQCTEESFLILNEAWVLHIFLYSRGRAIFWNTKSVPKKSSQLPWKQLCKLIEDPKMLFNAVIFNSMTVDFNLIQKWPPQRALRVYLCTNLCASILSTL